MTAAVCSSSEPDPAVSPRLLGWLTLAVAGVYAALAVGCVAILSQDVGIGGLFFLAAAAATAIAFAVFAGLGAALLVRGEGARTAATRAHILAAVLTVPVGTVVHGLVAWLARRREEPAPSSQAEAPALAEPTPEAVGSKAPDKDAIEGVSDLPLGIVLLVTFLGLAAVTSALQSLLWAAMFAHTSPPTPLPLLALGIGGAVVSAALMWGLARREGWAYWLVHVPLVLSLFGVLFRPILAAVSLGILVYLHRGSVKRLYVPQADPAEA